MKRELKSIEEYLLAYPNLHYDNAYGILMHDGKIVENSADELIEEYYEGADMMVNDGSGDPQNDYPVTMTGAQYVEHKYRGNFEDAFNDIPKPKLK